MSNDASYQGVPTSSEGAEAAAILDDTGQTLALPVLSPQISNVDNLTPSTLVNELPAPSPGRNYYQSVTQQCAEPVLRNGTIRRNTDSPASWTPGPFSHDQFRAHNPYTNIYRTSGRRSSEQGEDDSRSSSPWATPVTFPSGSHTPPLPTEENGVTPMSQDAGFSDQTQQPLTASGQRFDEFDCGRETPSLLEEKGHIRTSRRAYSAIFLTFQMGLPVYYFHRVAAIFEDAGFTIEQMKHLVSYYHLRNNWADFIDSILREWKTLNLVSVLLLTAIVATLQINAAFEDPVVYFVALYSLVCALLSLIFGCLYIVRFNTMRAPHKAINWAEETQSKYLTLMSLIWNVWLMLALPAIWLVWSILFYIICIMVFVWRVKTGSSPGDLYQTVTACARIGISLILAAGLAYLVLAIRVFIKFSENNSFKEYFKKWMILKRESASSESCWVLIDSMPPAGRVAQPDHSPNPNPGKILSGNASRKPPNMQSPSPESITQSGEQSGGPMRSSEAMNSPIPSLDLDLENLNSIPDVDS